MRAKIWRGTPNVNKAWRAFRTGTWQSPENLAKIQDMDKAFNVLKGRDALTGTHITEAERVQIEPKIRERWNTVSEFCVTNSRHGFTSQYIYDLKTGLKTRKTDKVRTLFKILGL